MPHGEHSDGFTHKVSESTKSKTMLWEGSVTKTGTELWATEKHMNGAPVGLQK